MSAPRLIKSRGQPLWRSDYGRKYGLNGFQKFAWKSEIRKNPKIRKHQQ
jgi:hypothetical protein